MSLFAVMQLGALPLLALLPPLHFVALALTPLA
jgi:hypothetical protein